MKEVERRGVVLDVCPQCGGVWLDKGELEKFLSQAREVEREAYHRKEGKPYKKKKGFLELFDLFD